MSAIFAQAAQQWREMRAEYDRHVEAAYSLAVEACSGVLVNADGRQLHVDGHTLFTGHAARAYRYASWELLEHWEHHPRLSGADFELRWLQGVLVPA